MTSIYIEPPFDTNPESIQAEIIAFIQAAFPAWTPSDGQLDVMLIRSIAINAAETRDVASRVPTSIFRYFGANILQFPPTDATRAIVSSTWAVRDNAGYAIPAGAQVGIRDTTGLTYPFEVLTGVTINPGSLTTAAGAVTLVALNSGNLSSGLGGAAVLAELITVLEFVSTVTLTGITTGGVDAESDTAYLDRLSRRLRRLSLRPILPADFSNLAIDADPAVFRFLTVDGYNPFANEIQTVDVDATGGTFTLTFSGQTTAAIAWNASAATLLAALEALSNIAPGDVIVTGGPGPALWTIEFTGTHAGTNVAVMTSNSAGLIGVKAAVTIDPGSAGGNDRVSYTADAAGTGGNAIRITYVVAGLNTALTVTSAGNDITVNVATDGAGAATSTASLVLAAVNAHAGASALVDATLIAGSDGTGIVAAVAFTNLFGGTDPSVTHSTTRQGSAAYGNERMVAGGGIDQAGNILSGPVKAAVDTYIEANREVTFIFETIDPTVTTLDWTYNVKALPNYDIADLEISIDAALSSYFSPITWGQPPGDPQGWLMQTIVRHLEIASVINGVEGVDYIITYAIGKNGGAQAAADVTLTGAIPLTNAGIAAGTVTPA